MTEGDEYRTRRVQFNGKERAVVMQSLNGPCPLLALANTLSLRGDIPGDVLLVQPSGRPYVSGVVVVQSVADRILHAELPGASSAADFERAVDDSIRMLPTLARGMDVNVRFDSCTAFEFTESMAVFDILRVRLLHAWLCDPNDAATKRALGSMSYNQAVIKRLGDSDPEHGSGGSGDSELIAKFLEETRSQITAHGLKVLRETVAEGELAVLFRNMHFAVLHNHGGELFLLVTDVGFAGKPIVWEKLQSTSGDTQFFDDGFEPVAPEKEPDPETLKRQQQQQQQQQQAEQSQQLLQQSPASAMSPDTAAVAAAIAAEALDDHVDPMTLSATAPIAPPVNDIDRDMALALQLQEQQEADAANHKSRGRRHSPEEAMVDRFQGRKQSNGNSDCTVS